MTLLKIARMGHPMLTRRAEDVADPTARDVRRLVNDMIETMDDSQGVGLAAPQVHVGRRVNIFKAPAERNVERTDDGADEADATATSALTALINPSFEPLGDEMALGWEVEGEASGFQARVVQHEIVHLDGVLFPMRMTDLSLLSFSDELRHFIGAEGSDDDGDESE